MLKNQIFRIISVFVMFFVVFLVLFVSVSILKKQHIAQTLSVKTEKFDFYDSVQMRHNELKNKYLPPEDTVFYVQVGAFKTLALAEDAEKAVKKVNAKYQTKISLHQDFFAVQVVNITTRVEAEVIQKTLQRKGFKDAFLKK